MSVTVGARDPGDPADCRSECAEPASVHLECRPRRRYGSEGQVVEESRCSRTPGRRRCLEESSCGPVRWVDGELEDYISGTGGNGDHAGGGDPCTGFGAWIQMVLEDAPAEVCARVEQLIDGRLKGEPSQH